MCTPIPSPEASRPRSCAQCGAPILPTALAFAPFCSRRCQQRDLANWLDERYGLPYEDPGGVPDTPSPDDEE